uniref:Uncharacterized protein n=1 Tax=Arundo donax TaxID=35708 RepID=A0A0A9PPL6_ARUDO
MLITGMDFKYGGVELVYFSMSCRVYFAFSVFVYTNICFILRSAEYTTFRAMRLPFGSLVKIVGLLFWKSFESDRGV